MKLFISHASEDKDDFVRPLAEALREIYDVWFDEYELTLGDSLLAKVNEGLRSSDFGIVVLSHHFFSKKWPQRELDGLFALETETRKVILPIWKDVTEADVAALSPILAGRLAVGSSAGLNEVVKEIRLAVDNSERKRQLTALTSASQRILGLDETLAERRDSAKLLQSENGASLVLNGVAALFHSVETTLSALAAKSKVLKFEFKGNGHDTFAVQTVFGLNLHLYVRCAYSNSASSASIIVTVFRQEDRWLQEFDTLSKSEFAPAFRSGSILVWKSNTDNQTYSGEELAAYAIDLLQKQIESFGGNFDWR